MSITCYITQPLVSNTTAHYKSTVSMILFAQVWTVQWSNTIPRWNVQLLVRIHLTWFHFNSLLRSFPQWLSTIIWSSWSIMIEWEVRKDKPKISFVQRCSTTTAWIFFWFLRVINGIESQFDTFPKFKFFDLSWIYCQVDLYRVLQGESLELELVSEIQPNQNWGTGIVNKHI